jgi:hypothetical protein
MDYGYEVVSLWKRPAADLLAGDIGALPLAVLGKLPEGVDLETGLAGVVEQLSERLQRERPPEQAARLLTAAYVLTGLRVSRQMTRELFSGVRTMDPRDSDSYLGILDEGRVLEAKKLLWRWGPTTLGAPDDAVKATVAAMTEDDLDRLERMLDNLRSVKSWQELLAIP